MLVRVTLTYDPARQAEIAAHIPAEQARGRELPAQGIMQALCVAGAQDRVWLVVRTASLDEARQVVESLPLHPFADVDLAPLAGPA